MNLQSYLDIELYSQFWIHFKASTITLLECILTSLNDVVEIILQIIIIMIKTITTLFLFYQLILVTFLRSNKLLNHNIANRVIYSHFETKHVATEIFLILYRCIFFIERRTGYHFVSMYRP